MADTLKQRPEFRNIHVTDLRNYRMPAAAYSSILHRISGMIMFLDRKSTRLNSSHSQQSRMPSSA